MGLQPANTPSRFLTEEEAQQILRSRQIRRSIMKFFIVLLVLAMAAWALLILVETARLFSPPAEWDRFVTRPAHWVKMQIKKVKP